MKKNYKETKQNKAIVGFFSFFFLSSLTSMKSLGLVSSSDLIKLIYIEIFFSFFKMKRHTCLMVDLKLIHMQSEKSYITFCAQCQCAIVTVSISLEVWTKTTVE